MNYLELITMNMSYDELVTIYTNLYDIILTERRVATGGSLAFTACVCELIQNIT